MDIERSTIVQAAAGAVSILVFVGLVVLVGGQNGAQALEPRGGLVMVGVLAFFVVFMAALGLALSNQLSED